MNGRHSSYEDNTRSRWDPATWPTWFSIMLLVIGLIMICCSGTLLSLAH